MATAPVDHLHWLEISRQNLLHNLGSYRKIIGPKTKIMSVVKANAYGHGLAQVTPVVAPGSDFLLVNTLTEALAVRRLKITIPILIAAPISPVDIPLASKHRISLCVHSFEYLGLLSDLHLPLTLHLKINTGTNRLGLSLIELLSALDLLRSSSRLITEGIYTHFHSSDSGSPATLTQFDLFCQAVSQTRYYFPGVLTHCASSSATLLYPQMRLDMIRLGVVLYGLWPDPYVHRRAPAGFSLKPVLSWKCRPVQIRQIGIGESVSYSATYTAKKPGVIAVLPIGYSDGFDRELSNTGRVWSAGHYCPVIGRVAMNFTMVDINCLLGDADPLAFLTQVYPPAGGHVAVDMPNPRSQRVVELLGPHISADEIAKNTGTINYEVVSRLSPLIPRLLV